MVRTKKRGELLTPARRLLINHVLIYFPHWRGCIKYQTNTFLIANCHPEQRNRLKHILEDEILKNKMI